MNNELRVTTPGVIGSAANGVPPKKYKSVPQNWKALPETKFRKIIAHIESVLFEISTDGANVNCLEGKTPPSTLNHWADHLRDALKALTLGQ